MKRLFRSKKGSFVILISMIFCSIIIFVLMILRVSGAIAIKSSVNSLGNLFTQNILAEYDTKLLERYGIFAVKLDTYNLEEKLDYYYSYSFNEKGYIDYKNIKAYLEDYRLVNGNNFLAEVDDCLLFNSKPEIVEDFIESDEETNRYIKAKWIINELPSYSDYVKIEDNILDEVSIHKYLFSYFKDYVNDRDLGPTFFRNEIEYVITGNLNDEKARLGTYARLLLVRNTSNIEYILTDSEKMAAINEVAILINPAAFEIAAGVLAEAWALYESKNDIELLYLGYEVPLIKTDLTFATSLDNVIDSLFKDEKIDEEALNNYSEKIELKKPIMPKECSGLKYDSYLEILLAEVPMDTKVYRILDLIQINFKYLYNGSFLLKEYYIGIRYDIEVNDRVYTFERTY